MITLLNDAPDNVAAFTATGEITHEDFKNVVIPHINLKMERFKELNYLLYINDDNDSVNNWIPNSFAQFEEIPKYNRAAIITNHPLNNINVSESENLKFFPKDNMYNAMYWCNNGKEIKS